MVDDVALMEEMKLQEADENGEAPPVGEIFEFSSLDSNDASGNGHDWLNELIAEHTSQHQPYDEEPDVSAERSAKVDNDQGPDNNGFGVDPSGPSALV